MPAETPAGRGHDLVNCTLCETVQEGKRLRCRFCGQRLAPPRPFSLQRTWSLLATAMIFWVPANLLPIMTTSELGKQSFNTIAGGVHVLWEHGDYPVALIILVASLLVPLAKFLALIALCLSAQFRVYNRPHSKAIVYRIVEFVGRWSMVDVFVVAFLAALIQLGNLLSVYPGPAALAFAGMVVFSMLAAASLDPKIIWNDYEHAN